MKLISESTLIEQAKNKNSEAIHQLRQAGYFDRKKQNLNAWLATPGQEQFWRLSQRPGQDHTYHLIHTKMVPGEISDGEVREAIDALLNRHEILRTTFFEHNEKLYQKIHPEDEDTYEVEKIELADASEEAINRWMQDFKKQPFSLERGPLFRAACVSVPSGKTWLVWVMHHIIGDAWSLNLLDEELSRLLNKQPLPPLEIQYRDYASWIEAQLNNDKERLHSFWGEKLAGSSCRLGLPAHTVRPRIFDSKSVSAQIMLKKHTLQGLEQVAKSNSVTLSNLLTALFGIALHGLTHSDAVGFGVVVNTRKKKQTRSLIGYMVNTLVYQNAHIFEQSLAQVLSYSQKYLVDAWDNGIYPFQQQLDLLEQSDDPALSPGTDALFTFQDASDLQDKNAADDEGETAITFDQEPAKADLVLECMALPTGLKCTFNGYAGLMDADTLKAIATYWETLIDCLLEQGDYALTVPEFLTLTEAQLSSEIKKSLQWDEPRYVVREIPLSLSFLKSLRTWTKDQTRDRATLTIIPAGEGYEPRFIWHSDTQSNEIERFGQSCKEKIPGFIQPAFFKAPESISLKDIELVYKTEIPSWLSKLQKIIPGAQSHGTVNTEVEKTLQEIWSETLNRKMIKREDDLFNLGGHSIHLAKIVHKIKDNIDPSFTVEDGFTYTRFIDQLEFLSQKDAAKTNTKSPVKMGSVYPVSPQQRRLWFTQAVLPKASIYNIPMVEDLDEMVDAERLTQSLRRLVERQESLRTIFEEENGELFQRILQASELPDMEIERYHAHTEPEITSIIKDLTSTEFGLATFPLFRCAIINGRESTCLVLVLHHIVADHRSQEIILNELGEIYRSIEENREPQLAALPEQYHDYAEGFGEEAEHMAKHKAYWLNHIGGDIPRLELPAPKKRPALKSYEGSLHSSFFDDSLLKLLEGRSKKWGASVFSVVSALLSTFLFRYSGQESVMIGVPVNGRYSEMTDRLVGYFINMLPLRFNIEAHAGFRDWVDTVSRQTRESLAHQRYPYDWLLEDADIMHAADREPLFDVTLAFQEFEHAQQNGYTQTHNGTAKFDLNFSFSHIAGKECSLQLEYATDLFTHEWIDRFTRRFFYMAKQLLENPDIALGRAPIALPEERKTIVEKLNDTRTHYPNNVSIYALFEKIVEQYPQHIALQSHAISLTYAKLEEEACKKAAFIESETEVRPGDIIAVLLPKSPDLIISLLAILKMGCAYLPLDAESPTERLSSMIKDCNAKAVITDKTLVGKLGSQDHYTVIRIDSGHWNEPSIDPKEAHAAVSRSGDDPAYVIYTSGSTGRPKGVVIPHRAITRLVCNTNFVHITPEDCLLLIASISFDAATFEIWGALLNGGKLALPSKNRILDASVLEKDIAFFGVTKVFLTTSLFNIFADHRPDVFASIDTLLVGGERLTPIYMHKVREHCPKLDLKNIYGPTENTTYSLYHAICDEDQEDIPLGKPISNSTVFITNNYGGLQPPGVPGEIMLGGDGLMKGYLNRPELNKKAFSVYPCSTTLLYHSGDIGYLDDNGDVLFVGRKDKQVKVRGYRIEIGEIEQALHDHPHVKMAAVETRKTTANTLELLAYYTLNNPLDQPALKDWLQQRLPKYMIPGLLFEIEKMPLNKNGKIDRSLLSKYEQQQTDSMEQPWETDVEQKIADVWSQVLNRPVTQAHQNFYELGGDSIQAIQIIAKLGEKGYKSSVRNLFRHPRVTELAHHIEANGTVAHKLIQGSFTILPVQNWFFSRFNSYRYHFNQSAAFKFTQRVDAAVMQKAIRDLYQHHEGLRLKFDPEQHTAAPVPEDSMPFYFNRHDLRGKPDAEAVRGRILESLQTSMNPATGELFHAVLFHEDQNDYLFCMAHHLAVDGISWRILMHDLSMAYQARLDDSPLALPPVPASLKELSEYFHQQKKQDGYKQVHRYWQELAREKHYRTLPETWVEGEVNFDSAAVFGETKSASFELSVDATQKLLNDTESVQHLLLAAIAESWAHHTERRQLYLLMESHGRNGIDEMLDLSRTVGWMTALYPVGITCDTNFQQNMEQVQAVLQKVSGKEWGFGVGHWFDEHEVKTAGLLPPISFNYLGKLERSANKLWEPAKLPSGTEIHPKLNRFSLLDLSAIITEGTLKMSITYDAARFYEEPLHQFLENIEAILNREFENPKDDDPQMHTSGADLQQVNTAHGDSGIHLTEQRKNGLSKNEVEESFPLSPLQKGLFYEYLNNPDANAYHIQLEWEFEGDFNPDYFIESWKMVARNHEILRTAFMMGKDDEPVQVVRKDMEPEFNRYDLTSADQKQTEERIREEAAADLKRGFDLSNEPLHRFYIFRTGDQSYRVIWSHHHITCDGWSLHILQNEFINGYIKLQHGEVLHPVPAPPYSDYISWLQAKDDQQSRDFWAAYLRDFKQHSRIRPFKSDTEIQDGWSERHITLDESTTRQIRDMAGRFESTPASFLQLIWAMTLHVFSEGEVNFGCVLSGRPPALQRSGEIAGLFINSVPIRIILDSNQPFADKMKEIHENMLDIKEHGFLSYNKIQEAAGIEAPLFDSLFTLQNYPEAPQLAATLPFDIKNVYHHDRTHYDINMVATMRDKLVLNIGHNPAAYPHSIIGSLLHTARHLIEQAVEQPEYKLNQFSLIPERDLPMILGHSHGPDTPLPQTDIVEKLYQQLTENPAEPALYLEDQIVSRHMLHRNISAVYRYLDKQQVSAGSRVGVCMKRSDALVSAIYGILWKGCSFVPIHPGTPEQRFKELVRRADISCIITPEKYAQIISDDTGDLCKPAPVETNTEAYLLFTSGSTGQPKGCPVSRLNMKHYLGWALDYFGSKSKAPLAMPMFTSITFDLTINSLFLPLLDGGVMYIYPETQELHDELRHIFSNPKLNAICMTPSHALALDEVDGINTTNISSAILGGEPLLTAHIQALRKLNPDMHIFNGYGPTEGTVGCMIEEVLPGATHITIGRPMDRAGLYITDMHGRMLPIGARGELLIAGPGVIKGYLDPVKTKEKFGYLTFGDTRERVYHSGDAVRRLADGRIEFLGRIDNQVKIRGHRIEPGEIEQRITDFDMVKHAVVVADASGSGNKSFLMAAVVSEKMSGKKASPIPELRNYLQRYLPSYMIPEFIQPMDELPKNANGKVDRSRVQQQLLSLYREKAEKVIPASLPGSEQNEEVKKIMDIFSEVLEIQAHPDTSFFKSGGHSLKAIQVISRISRKFNCKVSIRELTEHPTPAMLSQLLSQHPKSSYKRIPQAEKTHYYPLSNAQQRLWLLHNLRGEKAYNMPLALIMDEKSDLPALQQALGALIERHEILRTGYEMQEGKPVQVVHADIPITYYQDRLPLKSDQTQQLQEHLRPFIEQPFEIETPPLLRVHLWKLEDGPQLLLLTMHHIAGDGWSLNILVNELGHLYEHFAREVSLNLPELPIQYKDYAVWQQGQDYEKAEQYWLHQLKDAPRMLDLPYDYQAPEERAFRGDVASMELEQEIQHKLRQYASEHEVSLSTLMLAAFKLLLFKYSGQGKFCVGLSIANRNHPDLENLIGFFVNLLPLHTHIDDQMDFNTLLKQVDQSVSEALEYQHYPIDRLIQRLCPQREANRQPLFNVAFGFQNFLDLNLASNGNGKDQVISEKLNVKALEITYRSSKFDLTLFVSDLEHALRLDLEYDTELFDQATIRDILQNYNQFLSAITN